MCVSKAANPNGWGTCTRRWRTLDHQVGALWKSLSQLFSGKEPLHTQRRRWLPEVSCGPTRRAANNNTVLTCRTIPRCNRLAKDCTPSTTVRKSGTSKRRSKKSQIEEKLDGLVSLLQSQNPGRLPEESGGVTPLISVASERNGLHQDSASRSGHTSSIHLPSTSPHASPGSVNERYEIQELSSSSAERRLQRFRTQHLTLFPMLRISEHETAQSFRLQRPFLWLNICAVCAGSVAEQCALGDKAREILAKRVVVDCDRDLDLLEGLLVYLNWYSPP